MRSQALPTPPPVVDSDPPPVDATPDADPTCTLCHQDAICEYTDPGWQCVCREGYAGNGYSCEDVNECVTNNGGCLYDAECVNLPGTRQCRCQDGWVGDGETTCRTGLIFFANGSDEADRFFKSYNVASGQVVDETLMVNNDFCGCGFYCWSPMVAGGALYYFANDAQRYTTSWHPVSYPDTRRRGEYGAAVHDGKIYMVGSRDIVFTVQYFDTATNQWSALDAVANYPWKVEWPAVATIGDIIYVVGGSVDGAASAAMAVYNPATNHWTPLADAPFASSRPYAADAGGKMYVFAGGLIYVYDPGSGWETDTIWPPSGGGQWKPAVAGDELYVVGDANADVVNLPPQRIQLVPGTDGARRQPRLLELRGRHALAAPPNR